MNEKSENNICQLPLESQIKEMVILIASTIGGNQELAESAARNLGCLPGEIENKEPNNGRTTY
ncbi:hypothetical protein COT75_00470 [Candidatus Beckwithbacteria bacterium CG10_big_fil_rev_8_21_14_0_10_34_10]|uniref:Uncharacterized protein n=1 Tax=Candidatus Beckwithbacteria bacterium CG10_big_fil_rev_8_21_14_0_10_34_10 TaxID=1974495 RepID=A0A2H0WCK4_9BACT|nr:MAG: hypothetical protein COT75_00470 [Candidatus Beckwithbacteria bacterium CG10_big_fil_rev_8_21_14_0_10_34_10]